MTFGPMPDTDALQKEERIELTVRFSWTELGEIAFDDDHRLPFVRPCRSRQVAKLGLMELGAVV